MDYLSLAKYLGHHGICVILNVAKTSLSVSHVVDFHIYYFMQSCQYPYEVNPMIIPIYRP